MEYLLNIIFITHTTCDSWLYTKVWQWLWCHRISGNYEIPSEWMYWKVPARAPSKYGREHEFDVIFESVVPCHKLRWICRKHSNDVAQQTEIPGKSTILSRDKIIFILRHKFHVVSELTAHHYCKILRYCKDAFSVGYRILKIKSRCSFRLETEVEAATGHFLDENDVVEWPVHNHNLSFGSVSYGSIVLSLNFLREDNVCFFWEIKLIFRV